MNDLRTSLLDRIDGSLDAMIKAPRMWGSPESLELQALLLVELKCMILRPHITRENPGEVQEAYERFVKTSFDRPATLISHILKNGHQTDLPKYLEDFMQKIQRELAEENAFEHNDMVLDIEVRADRDIPSFAKICGYYERFMKALRAIVRHVPKEKTDPKDTPARATEYAVPEIRVVPGENGRTLIRIPLDQPKFGQLSIANEWMSEQRVREAIRQAMDVVVWAEEAEPIMGNLRNLFPDSEQRKNVAAHTIRMLPEAGIDAVRVGGKLLGKEPVELRPSQAPRIIPVLQEGELPQDFSKTGFVRAVDLDQKWFRLRYGDRTIKCWVHNAPDYLDRASQALADKTKVAVVGDEFRAAYRRPFVTIKDLVAA
jgi:hypothetical protein